MRREKPYMTFQSTDELNECLSTWRKILRMEEWVIRVKTEITRNIAHMYYNKNYKEIDVEVNIMDLKWSELDIIVNLLAASTDEKLTTSITNDAAFIRYLRSLAQVLLMARYDIPKEDLAEYRKVFDKGY